MAAAAPLPTAKRQLPCLSDRFGLRRAGSRRDFGGEVALLLLDAFAELEADEAVQRDGGAGVLRRRRRRPRRPGSCCPSRTAAMSSAFSLRNLARPPSTIFSTMFCGLAALLRLFHRDRALALDQRRDRARRRRAPAGAPPRRASRSACRARSASRPAPRSRARPARRSCRGPARPGCGRRTRPRPRSTSSTAARRSDWFSPILAMLSVSFSWTVPPPGYCAAPSASTSVPCSSASFATLRTKSWNMLVLGDEVGLRVDLDDGAAVALDGDADQALGGGAAGLLGGGGEALGAQPVDRGFHVAVVLGERLLAVHHAGAGALAQFLHSRGRDLSHFFVPSRPLREGRGRSRISSIGAEALLVLASGKRTIQASSAASTGGSAISPMSSPRAAALPVRPSPTACATASV